MFYPREGEEGDEQKRSLLFCKEKVGEIKRDSRGKKRRLEEEGRSSIRKREKGGKEEAESRKRR